MSPEEHTTWRAVANTNDTTRFAAKVNGLEQMFVAQLSLSDMNRDGVIILECPTVLEPAVWKEIVRRFESKNWKVNFITAQFALELHFRKP